MPVPSARNMEIRRYKECGGLATGSPTNSNINSLQWFAIPSPVKFFQSGIRKIGSPLKTALISSP
ncbi:hypothetical protein RhiTH_005926 [Rhizoctonia solani]